MAAASSQLKGVSTSIDRAISKNRKISRLDKDISVLKSDVRELKTDVRKLKTDVRKLKLDVKQLKLDVRWLKGEVKELRTELASIKTEMASMRNQMDKLGLAFEAIRSDFRAVFDVLVDWQSKLETFHEVKPRLASVEVGVAEVGHAFKLHIQDPKAHMLQ